MEVHSNVSAPRSGGAYAFIGPLANVITCSHPSPLRKFPHASAEPGLQKNFLYGGGGEVQFRDSVGGGGGGGRGSICDPSHFGGAWKTPKIYPPPQTETSYTYGHIWCMNFFKNHEITICRINGSKKYHKAASERGLLKILFLFYSHFYFSSVRRVEQEIFSYEQNESCRTK